MARETWAVYSVRDHLTSYAFLTDVLLYDRVRVPVPSDDDRDRWVREGWHPERQARLLEVLGDRARPLVWDTDLREQWRSNYWTAQSSARQTTPDAFGMTRDLLLESLPRRVTGVDTVAAYQSFGDLQNDAQLTVLQEAEYHSGIVAASIAWNFAVPPQLQAEPADLETELEVLATAVKLSDSKPYRRNRRSYWRWVQEFETGTITGQDAVEDGVALAAGNGYTVAHALNDWLTNYELSGHDTNTIRTVRCLVDKNIVPDLGARKLVDLSADDVDRWIGEKSKTMVTSTLRNLLSILRRAVTRAQARDRVKRNVTLLCDCPVGKGKGSHRRRLP